MDDAQFPTSNQKQSVTLPGRRGFLKRIAAAGLGALSLVAPVLSGIMVIFDPLRRKSEQSTVVQVTSLQSLPEDGLPRKFVVVSNHVDAWNRTPAMPIGAVYLRRTGPKSVEALNVVCPHAGCFVDYVPARKGYRCPCHNSSFALDGKVDDPKSPSPRALDQLQVEIRNDTEVWVRFQNFMAGRAERIPVA